MAPETTPPRPTARVPTSASTPNAQTRSRIAKWAIVAGVIGGLATGWAALHSTSKADPTLSASARAERVSEFQHSGTWKLAPAPGDVVAQAQATGLTGTPLTDLEARISKGEVKVVNLTLWDDQSEDGDVVSVESGTFHQVVPILNAHRTIAVPLFKGEPVRLVGDVDGGGGGITVAVDVNGSSVPLPAMAPGERDDLPVAGP